MSIKEIKAATRTKTLKLAKKELDISRGAKINHEGENTRIVAVHPDGRVVLENGKTVHKAQLQIDHEKRQSSGKQTKESKEGKTGKAPDMPIHAKGPNDQDLYITKIDSNGWVEARKPGSTQSRIYNPEVVTDPKTGNTISSIVSAREAAGVKTVGTGMDKWTRDERGRFA